MAYSFSLPFTGIAASPKRPYTPVPRSGGESSTDSLGFALVEKLFPEWIVMQCDWHTHRIRYVSTNSLHFLGYPAERLRLQTISEFFTYVHPDDRDAVHRVWQKIDALRKASDTSDNHQYRYVANYRFRKSNGQYIQVHHEFFQLPDEQRKSRYFSLLKDVSNEKPFTRVQLEIYAAYRKMGQYVPNAAEHVFTQREMDILRLIKDGMSSKEIADRLFISINTVRNHRSHLFKKTNARNVVELIQYASPGNTL